MDRSALIKIVKQTFLKLRKGLRISIVAGAICLPILAEGIAVATDPTTDLQVQIVDKNRRPIANKLTDIYSDNGMDCMKEPCPNNKKYWQGRTDRQGKIVIPRHLIQSVTSINIQGYSPTMIQPQSGDKSTILLFLVPR
jgi:hypothetical protein